MVAGKWSKTLAADVYPRAAIVALGAGFGQCCYLRLELEAKDVQSVSLDFD